MASITYVCTLSSNLSVVATYEGDTYVYVFVTCKESVEMVGIGTVHYDNGTPFEATNS